MTRPIAPIPPAGSFCFIGDLHFGDITASRAANLKADLLRIGTAPTIPTPEVVVAVGDLTEDGLEAEDTEAVAWMTDVWPNWRAVIGNHDLHSSRTGDETAQAWGFADDSWVEVYDAATLIALPAEVTVDLTNLDNLLSTYNDRPALLLHHYPLYNTHLGGSGAFESIDTGFYILNSTEVRAVLGDHDHARAWVSGHTHTDPREPTIITTETVGSHTLACINAGAPHYTNRDGEQLGDPITYIYVTVTATETVVRRRWVTSTGRGVWSGFHSIAA